MKKIWNGMPNGGTDINDNFVEIEQAFAKKQGDDISVNNLTVLGDLTLRYTSTSFPIGYGVTVSAKRTGNLVIITFRGSNSVSMGDGANMNEKIPLGYRPIETESLDPEILVRHINGCYYFGSDGSIKWDGELVAKNSYFRGIRSYFTKDPWPTN